MNNPISIIQPAHTVIDAAAAAASAQFTYRGGPLLPNVQIFGLYWGSIWQTDGGYQHLRQNLDTFLQYIVTSPVIDALAEYSTNGISIGHGNFLGSSVITQPSLPPFVLGHTILFDFAIQNMVTTQLLARTIPAQTPNTLYVVYLPAGVTVSKNYQFSCVNFCGYHGATTKSAYYAVLPYPTCHSCNNGLLPFDSLTITTSHEICEAITDAIPGQGWYDNTYGEIGDICAWKTKQLGPYTVQREWSQAQIACV